MHRFPVLARFAKIFVIGALACSLGFHWMFLQSIAWASMLVSYSQTDDLSTAVEKTFSGQHPCKLCVVVEKGKSATENSPQLKVESKLDFFVLTARVSSDKLDDRVLHSHGRLSEMALQRFSQPPSPPPRFV